MDYIISEESIWQTSESLQSSLQEKVDTLLNQVKEDAESLKNRFGSVIDAAGFSVNAFFPPWDLHLNIDSRHLPDGLFVGSMIHPVTGELFFPAILPFMSSNATGFCLSPDDDEMINETLQMFAFRLLLSIPIEQAQFHFIDLHSFGKSSKCFNQLSEIIKNDAFVTNQHNLSKLLTELEELVGRLNHNELTGFKNLREFNADPSHITLKYHFVFFPHLDSRVDRDIVSRICSLCEGMNASSCGIYFFYSVHKESDLSQNSPLNDLMRISTLVTGDEMGYRMSNSIYGKEFEERYAFKFVNGFPDNLNLIIEDINRRAENVKPTIVSFDHGLERLMNGEKWTELKYDSYWQGDTTEGIVIPIGRKGANGLVKLSLWGNTGYYSAMIGGRPGYGKTVLLHDIICNGSIIYSPRELEFYLIDCTNGTGFKPYENLPHARFVSITKRREYTDSAIEHLNQEMYRRADVFKTASETTGNAIEKIEDYRNKTGKEMTRILVIIDEFQVLLEKRDKLSRKIGQALEKLVHEGRKYGIGIIFCTQSFRNIDFDTELIKLRIAFNLKDSDSLKVLGSGNDSAAHLTKKGEAILNGDNGKKESNIIFQAAFTNRMKSYVDFCADKWSKTEGDKPKRFVFDGKINCNLGQNEHFIDALTVNEVDSHQIDAYIGVPMFLRERHSFVRFCPKNGNNLIICGNDDRAAVSTIALINYQICQSFDQDSVRNQMLISDYFPESSNWSNYLKRFAVCAGIQYLKKKELDTTLDLLEKELNDRINADLAGLEHDNSPLFLTIAYIQNASVLKKNQCNQLSKASVIIQKLLKDGPDYGIHLIVYSPSYKLLEDVLDRSCMTSFGCRILMHGGAIGTQLIEETNSLHDGEALLIMEDSITTYDQDPIKLYNEFHSNLLQDENLDYIFSIYDNN